MKNVEKIKKALQQFPESKWQGVVAANNTVKKEGHGRGTKYHVFAGGLQPIAMGTFQEVMAWIDDHAQYQNEYKEMPFHTMKY
jgi:glyceraldehyde-3-phosphate dehydrogenase/erythrose-4-phosphate dehydrogenase